MNLVGNLEGTKFQCPEKPGSPMVFENRICTVYSAGKQFGGWYQSIVVDAGKMFLAEKTITLPLMKFSLANEVSGTQIMKFGLQ